MEDGAFGISTGLDYPPGSFAETDELVELSTEAARLGGIYHTHVRYGLGDRYLDPFKEAIDIGRRSGVAVHLTHMFNRVPLRGGARGLLDMVEDSRAEGLDVTFDCFPYPFGGTRVLIMLPQWAQDGGVEAIKELLRSPEGRERLRAEIRPRGQFWDEMWLTYFKRTAKPAVRGTVHSQRGRDARAASGSMLYATCCWKKTCRFRTSQLSLTTLR